MKKIMVSVVVMMAFAMSGCETMKGLGADIQKAGKAIEKKAAE